MMERRTEIRKSEANAVQRLEEIPHQTPMNARKKARLKEQAAKIAIIVLIVAAVGIVGRMDAEDQAAKKDPCVYLNSM
jgi:hypothetical protein